MIKEKTSYYERHKADFYNKCKCGKQKYFRSKVCKRCNKLGKGRKLSKSKNNSLDRLKMKQKKIEAKE